MLAADERRRAESELVRMRTPLARTRSHPDEFRFDPGSRAARPEGRADAHPPIASRPGRDDRQRSGDLRRQCSMNSMVSICMRRGEPRS